jgi:lipoprotein-anchoring transpeptidase ErfK/SrfK
MGASVESRLHHKSKWLSISSARQAGLTGALGVVTAMALLGSSPVSVEARPFGFFSYAEPQARLDPRPSIAPRSIRRARPRHSHPAGEAKKGTHDFASKAKAPLQIIISLSKQQLTLYSGDEAIARTPVSTGRKGRVTPSGVFNIIQKDRWHRSNLYDDAPMYYMQRLTWSGVALHQGYVPHYPASHGCIRMPAAFAQELWRTTKLGVRVIIARGDVAPVAIEHPALFAPMPEPVMAQASSAAAPVSQTQSLQAAEQAWQIAMLDSTKAFASMAMTDAPLLSTPMIESPPLPNARPLKPGPISVFISRKEGKLFVRKGFQPVFETPVTIANPDQPLGTHVFTAVSVADHSARWTVVSMTPNTSASAALDRITIPQTARERISALMSAGASLIISDKGLGPETGRGTGFIVLNP